VGELELLAQSRVLVGRQWAACLEFGCVQLDRAAGDVRLKAVQHVKRTGHTVHVLTETAEELTPRPADAPTQRPITQQAEQLRGKARKAARNAC